MTRERCVLVGVDGSEPALRAVRWAAPEALRRRVPLRLVYAVALPDEEHREAELAAARSRIHEAAVEACRAAPGVEAEEQLIIGAAAEVLYEESRRAYLTVVGDRGRGGFAGLLVGSVPVTLAGRIPGVLVVVRGGELSASAPVVVGVDGSRVSEAAVAFAFDAAASRRVPLVAVHTWWDLALDPTLAPLLDWTAIEGEEHETLAERLAGWAAKYPDTPVERVVARDHPSRVLVDRSAGAQLVVVGSRGRGGFRGMVLGSVGHTLLHHAQCPVAIVTPQPE